MLDAVIIGAGPAGLSAALNLKLHNKAFLWFGSADHSHKVEKSEKIANYPGIGPICGTELNRLFTKQIAQLELCVTDKMVTAVTKMKRHYIVQAENDIYETKTLLLATGVVSGAQLEGESALLGHGVSYCATCDGFLYKNKVVAVICASKRFEHEAAYLAELAEKVYLYVPYENMGKMPDNVICLEKPLKKVIGEKRVAAIQLSDQTQIPVSGLFCLRDALAPKALLPGLETEGPHIVTDRSMTTSHEGCFAAGDCTGRPYQIAKAVGEGNIAAHSMIEYMARLDKTLE